MNLNAIDYIDDLMLTSEIEYEPDVYNTVNRWWYDHTDNNYLMDYNQKKNILDISYAVWMNLTLKYELNKSEINELMNNRIFFFYKIGGFNIGNPCAKISS